MTDGRWPGTRQTRGRLVARMLAGAWRPTPPPLDVSAETLDAAGPWLAASGAAGLVWRRLRDSALRASPAAALLRERYRVGAARVATHEAALRAAVERLGATDVEAVVVKGWAIARGYPEPGLRPYGDVDLVVRRADGGRARAALREVRRLSARVDLHEGFATLDDAPEDDLLARAETVDCEGTPIRVLGQEDHLRVLCRHLLRHGAVWPVWLADVAVAVETRGPGFDWDRCLGPDPRVASWVSATVGLAHRLIGARIDDTPAARERARPPRWLEPTVVRAWGRPSRPLAPLVDQVYHPRRLFTDLPRHWPNGIQATVALGRPFGRLPRLPFQVAATLPEAAAFVAAAARRLRAVRPAR